MDSQRAQAALDEVHTRQRQVADTVLQENSRWRYVGGLAAVYLAIAVSKDLDDHLSGLARGVVDYGVPVAGVLVIGVLMLAFHRSTRVRVRRYSLRAWSAMVGLAVALLGVYLGLGTLLRAYDIAWDNTISGTAAVLVFLAGCAVSVRGSSARPGSTREE